MENPKRRNIKERDWERGGHDRWWGIQVIRNGKFSPYDLHWSNQICYNG
jgi:hypothetical protein